ncbi:MAG: indolepyruvate ferredoxin oxidoreductase subunit alpha [Clostridiales bacterium]|nr:indolepyruvate ferredoxin oxidoreductase subunit alpha [Clostridiales bacterium]
MKKLMLGNEAVARGVYEAGTTVVSSYPGTPSTEITENIAMYKEIFSEWAPNEKVALEVSSGASIAGARAFSAMKHVGVNVAADPLFTMSYIGCNGGLVIAVADDPGMHSSQNEQDSRHYARAAKVMMVEPSDSQEAKDFTIKAFELSEQFDTPVFVRLSTRISHSQSLVTIGKRLDVPLKDYVKDVAKNVMMPAMGRKKHIVVEKRTIKQIAYAETSDLNEMVINDSKIGFISSGIAFQYAREVLPEASYLKLGITWPMPIELIKEFASNVDTIYVIEELEPIIEEHCKINGITVIGKDILPVTGEYSADLLRKAILNESSELVELSEENLPVRPPVLCPGCPHRGLYYAMSKLNIVLTGDIGCYTLGALPPLNALDTCVCMGGGISVAHGFEKARGKDFDKKVVGIVGDSTFTHSGITGLIDIVYNKGVSTVIVADNSITGMTGHQNNPVNGMTISGEPTQAVDLIKLADAIGIKRVTVVDPFDMKKMTKVLKEEISVDEPSLIISQRPCALLKHVNYKGIAHVDEDKCRGCKMCMNLGCPAITFSNGKAHINDTLCVGCGMCISVCPFDAISKEGN